MRIRLLEVDDENCLREEYKDQINKTMIKMETITSKMYKLIYTQFDRQRSLRGWCKLYSTDRRGFERKLPNFKIKEDIWYNRDGRNELIMSRIPEFGTDFTKIKC